MATQPEPDLDFIGKMIEECERLRAAPIDPRLPYVDPLESALAMASEVIGQLVQVRDALASAADAPESGYVFAQLQEQQLRLLVRLANIKVMVNSCKIQQREQQQSVIHPNCGVENSVN